MIRLSVCRRIAPVPLLATIAIAPLAMATAVLGPVGPARAAERLVLRYGPFSGAIAIADLEALADRGELSPALEGYLTLGKQSPETIRTILNQSVPVNATWLDRQLDSPWGAALLQEVEAGIQAPKGTDSRQALRAALSAAVQDDDRITLLEVLQQYPTTDVNVRVDRLMGVYERVSTIRERFESTLETTANPAADPSDRAADPACSSRCNILDRLLEQAGQFAIEILENAARWLDR